MGARVQEPLLSIKALGACLAGLLLICLTKKEWIGA